MALWLVLGRCCIKKTYRLWVQIDCDSVLCQSQPIDNQCCGRTCPVVLITTARLPGNFEKKVLLTGPGKHRAPLKPHREAAG